MAADCNSTIKPKPPPSSPIPWAQVVRGADSEAKPSPLNQSENKAAPDNNDDKSETEAATPVIGGGDVSWPALSECTRSNSSKTATFSQGPIAPKSSQKQDNHNHNSHSNSNSKHTMSGRQRSVKHRTQGGFSRPLPPPPLPPPFPIFDMCYRNFLPLEPSIGGARPTGGVVHLPQIGANHSLLNNLSTNESSGARPRGDWTYNHGNRHNQDRRDGHPPYQFLPRNGGFLPPQPPVSPPFISLPIRPLGSPIGFDGGAPLMYVPPLQGMPPPPPMLYPIDPNLPTLLLKQIDYYFSDANFVQDHFLRSKMDAEGWVTINLIANFRRVRQLTNNVLYILDCLKASKVVEVQGEKIRRRDDWKKWIHTNQSAIESHDVSISNDNAQPTFESVLTLNTNSDAMKMNIGGELKVTL